MQPLPDDEFLAQQRRRDPVVASRDVRTAMAVLVGLNTNERTRREPIRVSVQNDVVMLAGTVRTPAARDTAADIVRAVPAANDICNALSVRTRTRASDDPDNFERIVAGLEATPAVRRGPRAGAVAVLLIVVWVVLPVVTVAVGLPALPLVIAGLLLTTATIRARLR